MDSLSHKKDLVCGYPQNCQFAKAICNIFECLSKALFISAATECELDIMSIGNWPLECFDSVNAKLLASLPKDGCEMEALLRTHLPQYAGSDAQPKIYNLMAVEFREFVLAKMPLNYDKGKDEGKDEGKDQDKDEFVLAKRQ
jgi:hypothetical protein